MHSINEQPVVFPVSGSPVVGVLHPTEKQAKTGLLMVAAGGPQYRVGVARQLVCWARRFAKLGLPVLRFDYRGMGDSGGGFLGFESVDQDLKAAVDQLCQLTGVEQVVLFGGCNAASAILIYLDKDERVTQFIVSNPWMVPEDALAGERTSWLRLAGLKARLKRLLRREEAKAIQQQGKTFTQRMLAGLRGFSGKGCILVSSGAIAEEFNQVMNCSAAWQQTIQSKGVAVIELDKHGHNFGTQVARDAVFEAASQQLGIKG